MHPAERRMINLAKYKVVTREGLNIVNSKLTHGERINEVELQVFESQLIRGCFRPKWDGKKKIVYTAPESIELKRYLRQPLSETVFYEMIVQILEMVKRIENTGLHTSSLVLNIDYVFVSMKTKELFFLYQPIVSRHIVGNPYVFITEIVQRFQRNNTSLIFAERFRQFLNSKINCKIYEIEKYIKEECPQVYGKGAKSDAVRNDFLMNPATSLLPDGMDGTTVLQEEETALLVDMHYPRIRRVRTEETAEIRSNSFKIGKSTDCDFVVTDNKTVSRHHAVIESREGSFYITDQNSTNRSYVNNKLIEPGKAKELNYGDVIRLSDEEFCFEE